VRYLCFFIEQIRFSLGNFYGRVAYFGNAGTSEESQILYLIYLKLLAYYGYIVCLKCYQVLAVLYYY